MNLDKTTIRTACKECGSECHTAQIDENNVKTWECNNCGNETPRQTRVSKNQKEVNEMFGNI